MRGGGETLVKQGQINKPLPTYEIFNPYFCAKRDICNETGGIKDRFLCRVRVVVNDK